MVHFYTSDATAVSDKQIASLSHITKSKEFEEEPLMDISKMVF
jgi:hypothetical protein